MPLSRISFIMYLVHMNVENYILGLYPSNTSLNVTTGVSLYAVKLSTYPRTTIIYMDGRVIRVIIKPRPNFDYFRKV